MDATRYQEESLAGATGVELIVALYDATIRFLYRAKEAALCQDVSARRIAVKRVVDILMYLQARLRMDIGGAPAAALSDFYAAMFTLTLEASHYNSAEQFDKVIACVRNVRDAWLIVARDPEAGKVLPRELRTREERLLPPAAIAAQEPVPGASRWSA